MSIKLYKSFPGGRPCFIYLFTDQDFFDRYETNLKHKVWYIWSEYTEQWIEHDSVAEVYMKKPWSYPTSELEFLVLTGIDLGTSVSSEYRAKEN